MSRHHRHVMNVHQRPAGKGREPFQAVHQPRRLAIDKGQHAEGMRPPGQLLRQLRQQVRVKRLAAAHGVPGILVQHQADGFRVHRVAVAGL
ncbi:hypothetical protein D3C80_1802200 [compost metagenome]